MSEFENIQRLIRLKRFEQPEEGFTENFLREFHQRQRAAMLKQSSLELFLERAVTWWKHVGTPKWSLVGVAAAVCVGGAWFLSGFSSTVPGVAATPTSVDVLSDKPFAPKVDLSDLPMAHFSGRNDSRMEDALLRQHLEMRPVIESGVSPLPASANGLGNPKAENVFPAGSATWR